MSASDSCGEKRGAGERECKWGREREGEGKIERRERGEEMGERVRGREGRKERGNEGGGVRRKEMENTSAHSHVSSSIFKPSTYFTNPCITNF